MFGGDARDNGQRVHLGDGDDGCIGDGFGRAGGCLTVGHRDGDRRNVCAARRNLVGNRRVDQRALMDLVACEAVTLLGWRRDTGAGLHETIDDGDRRSIGRPLPYAGLIVTVTETVSAALASAIVTSASGLSVAMSFTAQAAIVLAIVTCVMFNVTATVDVAELVPSVATTLTNMFGN